jgi:hypothetical protein
MLVHASAEVMVEVEHVVEAGMIGAKVNSEQSLAVPADDGFLSDISSAAARFIAKQGSQLCFHAVEIHSLAISLKLEFCARQHRWQTGRHAALQSHGTHLGVFGTEFLMLVRMGSRMHEFVMGTLSTSRGRKMFALNARYFESSRTVAFFHDFIDAGCFDNPAWLMDPDI